MQNTTTSPLQDNCWIACDVMAAMLVVKNNSLSLRWKRNFIDLFHNGGQIKYSFVLMLISLSNLAAMCKIQKNFCAEMRPVSLINIDTKE